jgi:hypothetical protein
MTKRLNLSFRSYILELIEKNKPETMTTSEFVESLILKQLIKEKTGVSAMWSRDYFLLIKNIVCLETVKFWRCIKEY